MSDADQSHHTLATGQNGSQKIVHSFVCPNCATVIETEEPHKQALRVV
jgi:hypothetical protein